MASQGPYRGSATAEQADGTNTSQSWNTPEAVYDSPDTLYSEYVQLSSSGDITDSLYVTGFGFSIPAGATIDGIQADIGFSGNNTRDVAEYTIKLLKAGSPVGNNKASATATDATRVDVTKGGASDLWGATWSDTDINASTFGLQLQYQAVNGSTIRRPTIYDAQITVYYTAGGGGPTTYMRTVASSASVTDPMQRRLELLRRMVGALALNDSLISSIITPLVDRLLSDAISVTDTLLRYELLRRLLSDHVDVFDALRRTLTTYGNIERILSDHATAYDNLLLQRYSSRLIGSSAELRDSLVLRRLRQREVRSAADVLSDPLLREVLLYRTASDAASVAEALKQETSLHRLAQDSTDLYDALLKELSARLLARILADYAEVSDTIVRDLVQALRVPQAVRMVLGDDKRVRLSLVEAKRIVMEVTDGD